MGGDGDGAEEAWEEKGFGGEMGGCGCRAPSETKFLRDAQGLGVDFGYLGGNSSMMFERATALCLLDEDHILVW